ncbi:MAG: magnesium and cobalt transport protein CorA [Acidobacteriales bacterium]|nr:magnesium and cobalt transport protein CorA [Terriglobales bacterium]
MSAAQPIPGLAWFDIDDPDSPDLDDLAKRFGLHPLEIEDCRHRPQRAKAEDHQDYIFVVMKHLHPDKGIEFDDLDVFIGRDFIVTVHAPRDQATRVTARAIEEKTNRVDRLFYILLDEIVDAYLPVLDRLSDETSEIESTVLSRPDPDTLKRIFELKRKLIQFRRETNAMREVVNALMRREGGILNDDLDVYLRDVYDHLIRTVDLVETYRDLLTGSLDIYLSAVANRTNEVMKVLTIYGTVALPLIIITGFFGMNLPLPLQHSPHALTITCGIMGLSTVAILVYFKVKGWF